MREITVSNRCERIYSKIRLTNEIRDFYSKASTGILARVSSFLSA